MFTIKILPSDAKLILDCLEREIKAVNNGIDYWKDKSVVIQQAVIPLFQQQLHRIQSLLEDIQKQLNAQ